MNTLNPVWLIILAGIVALIPVLTGLMTSYLKVSIVLGMLKNGLGAQQVPGNLVIMALSLAITMYIMTPVVLRSSEASANIDFGMILKSPSAKSLQSLAPTIEPWREFMLRHAGEREIRALTSLDAASNGEVEHSKEFRILVPAFVLTEIKEAFAMGFVLLLPFLVVDLVVSNILAGMGMVMMSPMIISLPLKLILFVISDGWILVTKGLINSYAG